MKPVALPPRKELLRQLRYFPREGVLVWRTGRNKGKLAGSCESVGKLSLWVNGKHYAVHRLIWKMIHGAEPPVVDHKDGNGYNNRRNNLRGAGYSENNQNRRPIKRRLPKWVFVGNRKDRFRGCVCVNGVRHYITAHPSPEFVFRAAKRLASKLHGEFMRAA